MKRTEDAQHDFYISEIVSEHIGETPEGFLCCIEVPITRIGIFDYKADEVPIEGSKNGIVKIHRDESEVFSDKTIRSFEGKPITINHPNDFVTPQNWKDLAHGTIQNVRRGQGDQNDLLLADLIITTERAIELVKSGLREVSCGYDAEYEQISDGVGRQTNIIGNHLALVERGRAGGRCAIRDNKTCDSCGECKCGKNKKEQEVENVMKRLRRDSVKNLFTKFLDSIKDADLEEAVETSSEEGDTDVVAKATEAATQAKIAAEQAVNAAKEAAAIVEKLNNGSTKNEGASDFDQGKDLSEGGEEGLEEKKEDMETDQDETNGESEGEESDPLVEFDKRLERIESLIQQLLEEDKGDNSLASDEDGEGREEGDENKKKEKEDEDIVTDEDLEKKDGEFVLDEEEEDFSEVASKAEIIDPDMVVSKPNKDHATVYYKRLKKTVLKNALTGDYAPIVKKALRGRTIDSMSKPVLNATFDMVSQLIAAERNKKTQGTYDMKKISSANDIQKIQQANKDFYKNRRM